MSKEKKHTKRPILQVIRAKCIDCCCGDKQEVKLCAITDCDLHPYRFGKNPFISREPMSQDRKDAASAQFKEYRNRKKTEDAA